MFKVVYKHNHTNNHNHAANIIWMDYPMGQIYIYKYFCAWFVCSLIDWLL